MADLPIQVRTDVAPAENASSGGDVNPPQKEKCTVCGRTHAGVCEAAQCPQCHEMHKLPPHFCQKCQKCCGHTTAEHKGRVAKKTKLPPSSRPAAVFRAANIFNLSFGSPAEAAAFGASLGGSTRGGQKPRQNKKEKKEEPKTSDEAMDTNE